MATAFIQQRLLTIFLLKKLKKLTRNNNAFIKPVGVFVNFLPLYISAIIKTLHLQLYVS